MKIKQFLRTEMLYLKRIYYFTFFFLSFLVCVLISSCTKNEAIHNPNDDIKENDGITFRDGRLIFKDDTSFRNHEKWLFEHQKDHELIADKNKSLNFKSMTEYYFDGMKLEQDDPLFAKYVESYPNVFCKEIIDGSTIYFLPHSKVLCYIANKDGFYQIGEQVFRIKQNYTYKTNESKLNLLLLPKDQIPREDVKIMSSLPKQDIVKTNYNEYASFTVHFTIDDNFRVVSSLREFYDYDNNDIIWWHDEIWTTPQHRVLGIWYGAQLNTKAAHGSGYWKQSCAGCTQSPLYPGYLENTGTSGHAIWFGPWYDLAFSYSYAPAYSRGRLIDGKNTQFVYVTWQDAFAVPAISSYSRTSVLSDPY